MKVFYFEEGGGSSGATAAAEWPSVLSDQYSDNVSNIYLINKKFLGFIKT